MPIALLPNTIRVYDTYKCVEWEHSTKCMDHVFNRLEFIEYTLFELYNVRDDIELYGIPLSELDVLPTYVGSTRDCVCVQVYLHLLQTIKYSTRSVIHNITTVISQVQTFFPKHRILLHVQYEKENYKRVDCTDISGLISTIINITEKYKIRK